MAIDVSDFSKSLQESMLARSNFDKKISLDGKGRWGCIRSLQIILCELPPVGGGLDFFAMDRGVGEDGQSC